MAGFGGGGDVPPEHFHLLPELFRETAARYPEVRELVNDY